MARSGGVRILPRSLVPLPIESLNGFLLRLAHRLHLTVSAAATVTGLSDSSKQLPLNWMIALEPDRAARFARAAKLTSDEVDALTLAGLADRFPPLDAAAMPRRDPLRWIVTSEPWVFGVATRFCPECLAGDGSEIQNIHGGAWNKLWRLASSFACARHRRLLHHTCPACDTPAQLSNWRARHGNLLIPAADTVLHPAHCRSAVAGRCPGRFDQAVARPRPADRDLPHLLMLQDKLAALLQTAQPPAVCSLGRTVSAATYFADLHLTATLVRVAWFRARPDIARPHLVEDLAEYEGPDSPRRRTDLLAERYRNRSVGGLHLMPLDAAAGASLLALADEILSADDGEHRLRQLTYAAFAAHTARTFGRGRIHGRHSPILEALGSALAFETGPTYDSWVSRRLGAFADTMG